MFIINAILEEIIAIDHHIYVHKILAPQIASIIKPGQFVNIRVCERVYPLLRRPFSVCDVEGDYIYLMFNIMGEGTSILAQKSIGSGIDILGPLGHGFNPDGNFDTAVIVAGGLGAAPFPYLMRLLNKKKKIITFVGGKTKEDVITYKFMNVHEATDDGSLGFKGNVVQLLSKHIDLLQSDKIKVFACGPTVMLRALKDFCMDNNFECEVSTECAMACGFGICQGCPIESTHQQEKYLLVCQDGPVFNIKDVVI